MRRSQLRFIVSPPIINSGKNDTVAKHVRVGLSSGRKCAPEKENAADVRSRRSKILLWREIAVRPRRTVIPKLPLPQISLTPESSGINMLAFLSNSGAAPGTCSSNRDAAIL